MRLIDADWLEGLLLAHEQNVRAMVASGRKTSFTYADGIRTGYADVGLCPTIEAEPVVRCKDCKYKVGENTEYNDAHCGIHERGNNRELTVGDYDYCSWGELKESEEE